MRPWWARVGEGYGRWVPTGLLDLDDAKFYLVHIYQTHGPVIEWLQL